MTLNKKVLALSIAACMSTTLYTPSIIAADTKATKAEQKKEKKQKSIAEITKNHVKHNGLFTLFQNKKSGAVLLQLNESQLNSEFI